MRVRATYGGLDLTKGREYEIVAVDPDDVDLPIRIRDDAGDVRWLFADSFEPLTEPTSAAITNAQDDKPKFKVGDRVRAIRSTDNVEKGETYTVLGYARPTGVDLWVMLDGIRGWTDDGSYLEQYFEPAGLTIQPGKHYITRDGRKVGPARPSVGTDYPWWVGESTYTDSGEWLDGCEDDNDLVAEADEPAKADNDYGRSVLKFKDGRLIPESSSFRMVSGPTPRKAIVCLIESGQPKPANLPHVHASTAAAEREAARLASRHKGREFGVYELVSSKREEPAYEHEWQRLAARGEKIAAILQLRRDHNFLSLRSAKGFVEDFLDAA
jgi:hypothetical protein